jgi:1,4-dihydroxy-2-naphthoyl-CoA synthase
MLRRSHNVLNHKLRKGAPGTGAKANRMDESILVARDGAVATLTLNRPAVLNALNAELLERLTTAPSRATRIDSSIRFALAPVPGAPFRNL